MELRITVTSFKHFYRTVVQVQNLCKASTLASARLSVNQSLQIVCELNEIKDTTALLLANTLEMQKHIMKKRNKAFLPKTATKSKKLSQTRSNNRLQII